LELSTIHEALKYLGGFKGIYVPEFTWEKHRIDALIIDIEHRWIRGFEIKTRRNDFTRDQKFTEYSIFCSSLSIVCPEGLIESKEIEKPIGLLWIKENRDYRGVYGMPQWKKRPQNFQKRNGLSWLWTYTRVLELEFPRVLDELNRLKERPAAF